MKKTLTLAMSTLLLMGALIMGGGTRTIDPPIMQSNKVEVSELQLAVIDPPIMRTRTIDPPILNH